MSTLLPVDDNGHPIGIVGYAPQGTLRLAVGAASVRNGVPIADDVTIVSLIATGPCRFEVGGPGVVADVATSPFLYPGQYVDLPLRRNERHVAFVAEDTPCFAYIIGRV